jgi:CHASE3 domain sensor protein
VGRRCRLPGRTRVAAVETSVLGAESGLDAYLIAGTSSSLEPYRSAVQVHDYQLNELVRLGTAASAEQHLVVLLTIGTDDYFHGWAVPLLGLAQTDLVAARAQVAAGVGQQRLEDLRSRFADFTALEQRNRTDAAARASALGTLAEAIGLAGLLIIGLLALASVVVIKRFVAPADPAADRGGSPGRRGRPLDARARRRGRRGRRARTGLQPDDRAAQAPARRGREPKRGA